MTRHTSASFAALFLLALLLCVPAWAWSQCPGITTQVTPFAMEELPISDIAKPLTSSVYKPTGVTPNMASVSVDGGMIRYRVVGTPTATSGHPATGTFVICGYDNITAFRAIRMTTDVLLTVTYYRPK